MNEVYRMTIAGVTRDLPLCKVNDELYIAAFIMFGDVEITKACAKALIEKAPEHDIMITAESKGIPLIYEMARQLNADNYIIARKGPKVYMKNVIHTLVNSITTISQQMLFIGEDDANALRGKRVLIVDDVISTGESLAALEKLVNQVGGNIVGKMAVLAEGDSISRPDIIALESLPVFDKNGEVIK